MLSSDGIKEIQLRELEYIDTVCTENGLEYSLTYEIQIGAVRHKRVIPWDDELEILQVFLIRKGKCLGILWNNTTR